MSSIQGPAIFLAQFMADQPPFDSLDGVCQWAAQLGYRGIQLPTTDPRLIDLSLAASSQDYCDELRGRIGAHGLVITELSTHLQGQLVATHPAYEDQLAAFAPAAVRASAAARTEWATQQVMDAARASRRLGLTAMVTFSGSLLWPYAYPWPQRPAGLIELGFGELAKRWLPILEVCEENGVDACYELHPGEDAFDGASFELFLAALHGHARCCINYDPSHFLLMGLDYLEFIDLYHERIRAFHVKDAEFTPSGRQGFYSGYQSWVERAARFRSPGDGQVDFKRIFSKLTQYGYRGWAVLEWECAIKSAEQGAAEGVAFINNHLIEVAERAFDDFARTDTDEAANRRMLGLD